MLVTTSQTRTLDLKPALTDFGLIAAAGRVNSKRKQVMPRCCRGDPGRTTSLLDPHVAHQSVWIPMCLAGKSMPCIPIIMVVYIFRILEASI